MLPKPTVRLARCPPVHTVIPGAAAHVQSVLGLCWVNFARRHQWRRGSFDPPTPALERDVDFVLQNVLLVLETAEVP